jgi:hypothetical protein
VLLSYLTACPGRDQASKHLLNDIGELPFIDDRLAELPQGARPPLRWMFIGAKGCITRTHIDPALVKSWLVQVKGRKRFVLAPPAVFDQVRDEGGFMSLDSDTLRTDKTIEVTLEPGDLIFIPEMWIHEVQCLDTCITLTADWITEVNMMPIRYAWRRYLASYGHFCRPLKPLTSVPQGVNPCSKACDEDRIYHQLEGAKSLDGTCSFWQSTAPSEFIAFQVVNPAPASGSTLSTLALVDCSLTTADLNPIIASCQQLTKLSIASNVRIDDGVFQAVSQLNRLQLLDVSFTGVTSAGLLASLAIAWPELTHLLASRVDFGPIKSSGYIA